MKIAHIDNNNNILGWYDTDIHKNIPTPQIEVTDTEWREAISTNANTIENGKPVKKDKRTQEEKDKEAEDQAWSDYLKAEAEDKKTAWKLAGKPKYKGN